MTAIFYITCEIDLTQLVLRLIQLFFQEESPECIHKRNKTNSILLPQPISSSDVFKISRATQRLKHDWHSEKKQLQTT